MNNFNPGLIILIPLGLIGLSLVFFSRGILIFLTTLCLMLGQSGIPEIITITSYLRWIFFILFVMHVFGDIFLGRTVRKVKFFDILAIVFVIYAFISSFYSLNPSWTIQRATTILLLYISIFWIIWKYAYDKGPEKVVHLILKVALLIIIASYLMIFISPRAFYFTRFTGLFQNPNSLGMICAILLPLSLWQFLDTKKKSALLLFILMLVGLFLSVSRGSMNAMVVSMGYFIYARSKKYRPLVFFSSISFGLILIWVIETILKESFKVYIRAETFPTGGGRFESWSIALNLIIDKPILGYGFGVEELLMPFRRITLPQFPITGTRFHNSYLGIMLQLGIPGFIIFFSPLFILLFKELFSKPSSSTSLLRYALRASVLAGLICCLFESWVYSAGNSQSFPFWIIVMLLTFYRYQEKEKVLPEGT